MTSERSLGFLVHHHELLNHLRNVLYHLGDQADVVVMGPGREKQDAADRARHEGFRVVDGDRMQAEGRRYHCLVSNHYVGGDAENGYAIHGLGERNVRFMYALGKAGWNFAPWNAAYDAILCFGPWQMEQVAKVCDAVLLPMGYPRYDHFFTGGVDPAAIRAELGCRPDRPTLVWLPTWQALSSIPRYARTVAALSERYNLLVKPHPGSLSAEPDHIALLRSLPFTRVIEDHYDNCALYAAGDVVLSDYGGTMFGAIYCDRPLVLLNLAGAAEHPQMTPDSADLWMRRYVPALDEPDPAALERLVKEALTQDGLRDFRRQARTRFFAPFYGCGAEIAATYLRNIETILRHGRG